jgi:hypothetical protein
MLNNITNTLKAKANDAIKAAKGLDIPDIDVEELKRTASESLGSVGNSISGIISGADRDIYVLYTESSADDEAGTKTWRGPFPNMEEARICTGVINHEADKRGNTLTAVYTAALPHPTADDDEAYTDD